MNGGSGPLEDGEELVGAGVDLAASRLLNCPSDDLPDLPEQGRVVVAQPAEEGGRVLDVGQEEGDEAGGKAGHVRRTRPDPPDLSVDEAHRHDPVLLGRIQQSFAGALLGRVVLEGNPAEAGQGVPNVRLVVDGQPAPPA